MQYVFFSTLKFFFFFFFFTCYESSVPPAGHLVVLGLKSSDTKTKKLKAEHVIYPWKADILVIRTMQSTQQVKSVSLSYHQQLNKQQQI